MKAQSFFLTLMFVIGISLSSIGNLNELNEVNFEEYTILVDELEEQMEIEDWMIEDEIWMTDKQEFTLVEEVESSVIEDWMTDDKFWN